MTRFFIPNTTDPFQSFRTRLDGVDYLMSFAYNQREDRIYLSLADDEEVPIVSGLKVLANWPLLRSFRFLTNLPPGELIAIDTSGDGSPPKLNELGEGLRCQLMYYDAAELAALRPAPPPPQIPIAIFIAVRITVSPPYFADGYYLASVRSAIAMGLTASFGTASSFGASDVPIFGGSLGTITGVAIGEVPPPVGPTSIATTQIQLPPTQALAFDESRVSVVAV